MKNKTNIITIVIISIIILSLSFMFFVVPDRQLSQQENRSLSQFPKFSWANLFSGKYTSDLTYYISDQFPARDAFISIKAYSELALGKRENNGVIYANGGILIPCDEIVQNKLNENLDSIKEFEKTIGISVCVAAMPRTVDVFSEYLPTAYPIKTDSDLWAQFYNETDKRNITAPDLYTQLCENNNYYHSDHHYTSFGAYEVYELLGDALNYEPVALEKFKVQTVSNDFCGTSMRTSGFYLAPRDIITLFRYSGDTDLSVKADGAKISLYDFSKLEETDKYAVFLGGNHARVDIATDAQKPKMLIIRDSFADSIVPFLAIHYDLTLIDLRYFTDNVQKLVLDEKFDAILVLESIRELATNENLSYLRRPI